MLRCMCDVDDGIGLSFSFFDFKLIDRCYVQRERFREFRYVLLSPKM